jgi:hypothetical protein
MITAIRRLITEYRNRRDVCECGRHRDECMPVVAQFSDIWGRFICGWCFYKRHMPKEQKK